MNNAIEVCNISKRYGSYPALDDVSLAVANGRYVCLMGPSGSGKTTLLRLVAGLETADGGSIRLHGRDAADLRPHMRDTPLVFQHHALWPHMTVLEQAAFSLEERGIPVREARGRALATLDRVGLSRLAGRRPMELSGGERQRAALARALAVADRILLLDEPLANLDTHLRYGMRRDLRRLSRQEGLSVLHVTHDREEAFHLADTVVLLRDGRMIATGSPDDLYDNAPTVEAAAFMGGINQIPGTVLAHDGNHTVVDCPLGRWLGRRMEDTEAKGREVVLLFRPESVRVADGGLEGRFNQFRAKTVACHRQPPLFAWELRTENAANGPYSITWADVVHNPDFPVRPVGQFKVPPASVWVVPATMG